MNERDNRGIILNIHSQWTADSQLRVGSSEREGGVKEGEEKGEGGKGEGEGEEQGGRMKGRGREGGREGVTGGGRIRVQN